MTQYAGFFGARIRWRGTKPRLRQRSRAVELVRAERFDLILSDV